MHTHLRRIVLVALLVAAAAPAQARSAARTDSTAAVARPAKAAKAAKIAAPADSAARAAGSLDTRLERALARMGGVVPGSDTLVDWPLFRANAERTVDLIVPTLQPVRRELWLGAPNMVWRVRVLQRLTGLEFRAPTRARLSEDERRYLAPDSAKGVRFAGELRAEGKTWTAPRDAQAAILKKWRDWWSLDAKKPELPVAKHDDDRTWWY